MLGLLPIYIPRTHFFAHPKQSTRPDIHYLFDVAMHQAYTAISRSPSSESIVPNQRSRRFPICYMILQAFPSFVIDAWSHGSSSHRIVSARAMPPTIYLTSLQGLAVLSMCLCNSILPYVDVRHAFAQNGNQSWLALPILRLWWADTPMQSLIFIISGYILSLKTMIFIESEDWNRFLDSHTRMFFRRTIRLFCPAILSTFIVMLLTRLYLFEDPFENNFQIVNPHPIHFSSTWDQFCDWAMFVYWTLTNPWTFLIPEPPSSYGAHLIYVPFAFRSTVFLILTNTILSRINYRARCITFPLVIFYFQWFHYPDIALYIAGGFLAQLDVAGHHPPPPDERIGRRCTSYISRCVPFVALSIGLYALSFPPKGSHEAPGYVWTSSHLSPWFRDYHAFGAALTLFAILRMPRLQRLVDTSVARYLGTIAYPLYLIHEPLLHVFGWQLVKVMWRVTGSETTARWYCGLALSVLVNAVVIVWIADLWWRGPDYWCREFASLVTRCIGGDSDEVTKVKSCGDIEAGEEL
jgi:peptidoglycan/LPS O-acetylase OafA/YrhL